MSALSHEGFARAMSAPCERAWQWLFICGPGVLASVIWLLVMYGGPGATDLRLAIEGDDINDATGAYLSVAGLVFGLLVAQALSQGYESISVLEDLIQRETSNMSQLLMLTSIIH